MNFKIQRPGWQYCPSVIGSESEPESELQTSKINLTFMFFYQTRSKKLQNPVIMLVAYAAKMYKYMPTDP